jgi:hypothetical protein
VKGPHDSDKLQELLSEPPEGFRILRCDAEVLELEHGTVEPAAGWLELLRRDSSDSATEVAAAPDTSRSEFRISLGSDMLRVIRESRHDRVEARAARSTLTGIRLSRNVVPAWDGAAHLPDSARAGKSAESSHIQNGVTDLSGRSFEQFVQFVFARPVTEPEWYWDGSIGWEVGDLERFAEHVVRLFREPDRWLKPYSPEQIHDGFWFFIFPEGPFLQIGICSDRPSRAVWGAVAVADPPLLLGKSLQRPAAGWLAEAAAEWSRVPLECEPGERGVSLEFRIQFYEAVVPLFERLFVPLGLQSLAEVWWEELVYPEDRRDIVEVQLETMARCLRLGALSQKSALSGLAHIRHPGAADVIRAFLQRDDLTNEVREKAEWALGYAALHDGK